MLGIARVSRRLRGAKSCLNHLPVCIFDKPREDPMYLFARDAAHDYATTIVSRTPYVMSPCPGKRITGSRGVTDDLQFLPCVDAL